jgi:hypothetical protein
VICRSCFKGAFEWLLHFGELSSSLLVLLF